MNASQQIVLLTATITPPKNAKNLAIVDAQLRLQQYLLALEFYLQQLSNNVITSIVFVDNSASDCTSLKDLVSQYKLNQHVEIMSFNGLDYPPIYGRGYGEFKLVQHAIHHSAILQSASNNAVIWKITGRYIVSNLAHIIRKNPIYADFYCHCRNHPMRWIDLYILAWKKSAYDLMLKDIYLKLQESDNDESSELKFRAIVDANTTNIKLVKRFNTLPNLIGYRGYDNQPYQNSFKYQVRSIANTLVPFLWI